MANSEGKNNSKVHKILIISTICILAFFVFLRVKQQTNQVNISNTIPTPGEIKKYHSNILGISIDIPHGFILKEQLPEVLLIKDGHIITIHWVGTNKIYKTIDEFLDYKFTLDNEPKNIERKKVFISGYDVEVVQVEYSQNSENNNKAYYFHINNGFYHLYTRSPELYFDLDQIAQSFRYTP